MAVTGSVLSTVCGTRRSYERHRTGTQTRSTREIRRAGTSTGRIILSTGRGTRGGTSVLFRGATGRNGGRLRGTSRGTGLRYSVLSQATSGGHGHIVSKTVRELSLWGNYGREDIIVRVNGAWGRINSSCYPGTKRGTAS